VADPVLQPQLATRSAAAAAAVAEDSRVGVDAVDPVAQG